ncbi:hypothetical protein MRX96_021914 [Rhipicephalus microplus]
MEICLDKYEGSADDSEEDDSAPHGNILHPERLEEKASSNETSVE